ncbi:hypothetical protein K438DRAFT_1996894 [Mycena galopus ATCC 62051]|nr:hypothetical protein K438DRAFT_1996894 [Mycena galopus ATCC 62051]
MGVPSIRTILPQGLCVYWEDVDVVAPRAEDLGALLVMPVAGWSHCWPDACKNQWRPPFVLPPTPVEATYSAASEPRIKVDVQLLQRNKCVAEERAAEKGVLHSVSKSRLGAASSFLCAVRQNGAILRLPRLCGGLSGDA